LQNLILGKRRVELTNQLYLLLLCRLTERNLSTSKAVIMQMHSSTFLTFI